MKILDVTGNNSHQKLYLRGNPNNPEPLEVTLFFPGGHIGVARCYDGKYWAHIQVNDKDFLDNNPDCDYVAGKHSDFRVDCREERLAKKMQLHPSVYHLAMKIQPLKRGESSDS